MAGRPQKPAAMRQDQRPQRTRSETQINDAPVAGLIAPAAPLGLLKATKELWDYFWTSPLAGAVRVSEYPELMRWIKLSDQHERLYRLWKRQPFVTGSMGQTKRHPAFDMSMALAVEIRQLEDRMGMNLQARMRVGLALADQASALDALNDAMNSDDDDGEWVE